ncbi:pistil-specific extensin-like protein [Triticum aestivum]|uniref:pistil-specific extensin-like protein n=1 Tax=Triticum aestivum TaxID=4565 RepID=UPI001D024B7B|nr:pistil-specific extensin-like protein [Triticum aestivum]
MVFERPEEGFPNSRSHGGKKKKPPSPAPPAPPLPSPKNQPPRHHLPRIRPPDRLLPTDTVGIDPTAACRHQAPACDPDAASLHDAPAPDPVTYLWKNKKKPLSTCKRASNFGRSMALNEKMREKRILKQIKHWKSSLVELVMQSCKASVLCNLG